jgi:Holliday junction resolvase RusA-like endonuclease
MGDGEDAMNGITLAGVWEDDSGIVELRARAEIDRTNPGVEITITEGVD